MLERGDPCFTESRGSADKDLSSPSGPCDQPAVLFSSRGEFSSGGSLGHSCGPLTSSDPLWVLRTLVSRHVQPGQDCGECRPARQGGNGEPEDLFEGKGEGEESCETSRGAHARSRLGSHSAGRRARCATPGSALLSGSRSDMPIQSACDLDLLPEVRDSHELHPEDGQVSSSPQRRPADGGHQAGGVGDFKDRRVGLQSPAQGHGYRPSGGRSERTEAARKDPQSEREDPSRTQEDRASGSGATPPKASPATLTSSPGQSSTGESAILIEGEDTPIKVTIPDEMSTVPGNKTSPRDDGGGAGVPGLVVKGSLTEELRSLEEYATYLLKLQAFSYQQCEKFLMRLAATSRGCEHKPETSAGFIKRSRLQRTRFVFAWQSLGHHQQNSPAAPHMCLPERLWKISAQWCVSDMD